MESNAWQRRAGGLIRKTLMAPACVPEFWTPKQRMDFFAAEVEANAQLLRCAKIVDVPRNSGTPHGHRKQLRFESSGREFVGKALSQTDAIKAQAASMLANICGLPNPIIVAGTWHGHSLAAMPVVSDFEHVRRDLPIAVYGSDTVLETLLASRGFNECIWNLDCWPGNYLVPAGATASSAIPELVNIDFDDCLVSRRADWLLRVLHMSYGVTDRPIAECRWSEGRLDLESPLHYDPERLDSHWTIFGSAWQDLLSRLDEKNVAELEVLSFEGVSETAFECIWKPYLDHCWDRFRGFIPVQASQEWLVPEEFLERLFRRFSAAPQQVSLIVEQARRASGSCKP